MSSTEHIANAVDACDLEAAVVRAAEAVGLDLDDRSVAHLSYTELRAWLADKRAELPASPMAVEYYESGDVAGLKALLAGYSQPDEGGSLAAEAHERWVDAVELAIRALQADHLVAVLDAAEARWTQLSENGVGHRRSHVHTSVE